MKEVIQLQEIRTQIKQLKEKENELSATILEWLKAQNAKKAQTPYGTISITARTTYKFTEEVEAIKEELVAEQNKEKERAISRDEWEELGRPEVPIYDVQEHIRFTPKKEEGND